MGRMAFSLIYVSEQHVANGRTTKCSCAGWQWVATSELSSVSTSFSTEQAHI